MPNFLGFCCVDDKSLIWYLRSISVVEREVIGHSTTTSSNLMERWVVLQWSDDKGVAVAPILFTPSASLVCLVDDCCIRFFSSCHRSTPCCTWSLLERFQVDTPGAPHCPDYGQARHTADHSKSVHIRAQWWVRGEPLIPQQHRLDTRTIATRVAHNLAKTMV